MNPGDNPFNPGAGLKPPFLAGRDSEIDRATIIFRKLKSNKIERSIAIYGLRGVGKTVLLNEFKRIADNTGLITDHIEVIENEDFKKLISRNVRKIIIKISPLDSFKDKALPILRILKSFSMTIPDGPEFKLDVDGVIGVADSGNLTQDLIDLFINLGNELRKREKQVCFFIDEVQYFESTDFSALILAIHRLNQENLPIIFMIAGLPQLTGLAGEAKSYAERLFHYMRIDSLNELKAKDAIRIPIKDKFVTINEDAIDYILLKTERYPYFIQEYGKIIWDEANNPISLIDAERSYSRFLSTLDDGFFKVRLDRTTDEEKKLLKAIANNGYGPYLMKDVEAKYEIEINSLMKKGLIYSLDYNSIDFTVPLFDDFIRRTFIQ